MRKGKGIIATHWAPDLDAVAAITLLLRHGNEKQRNSIVATFLKGGDIALNTVISGIITVDRGKGEFDHHRKTEKPETSTSLVAETLGIAENKPVKRLIRKVERSDLQGESLPFDASDIIKCMQRIFIPNEEIIEIGRKIVQDCLEFSEKKLERNNSEVQKIVIEFLETKEIKPPKFQQYINALNNPKFERPFDLAEILAVEKTKEFIWRLLEFEYRDSVNYLKARDEELPKAEKIKIKWATIVIHKTDNPRFKDAARNVAKAAIVIQRNLNGQTQIFFDTQKINDPLVETLVSMIRLEECLIQGREIPRGDLRKPEWVEGIPEWYYFKAPRIPGKKKKPGRFILNGSLTAPEIPASKIPLETLREIAIKAVMYQPFNWGRWKAERLAYYANKRAA